MWWSQLLSLKRKSNLMVMGSCWGLPMRCWLSFLKKSNVSLARFLSQMSEASVDSFFLGVCRKTSCYRVVIPSPLIVFLRWWREVGNLFLPPSQPFRLCFQGWNTIHLITSQSFYSSRHFAILVWRGFGGHDVEYWTWEVEMSTPEALTVGKACCARLLFVLQV